MNILIIVIYSFIIVHGTADYYYPYYENCQEYNETRPKNIRACWNSSDSKSLEDAIFFEVNNEIWPPLPMTYRVEHVVMRDVRPQGVFGGCSALKRLDISGGVDTTLMSPKWLANCTKLQSLLMEELTESGMFFVLESVGHVEKVIIRNFFQRIDIHKLFRLVSSFSNRNGFQMLKELMIDIYTELKGKIAIWPEFSVLLTRQLAALPRLEKLSIRSIEGYDFCPKGDALPLVFKSLKTLELFRTSTSRVCFRNIRVMPKIELLDLQINEITELQFSELHSTPASKYELKIMRIHLVFSRDDYVNLHNVSQKGNVTIHLVKSTIDCDCLGSLWFARALAERLVTVVGRPTDLVCSGSGENLSNQNCERLKCDRVVCDSPCVCCRDLVNGNFVDCRGANLATFPASALLTNVTELLAPNNSITTLPHHLPDSLHFLDISTNKVWHLSAEAVSALFAAPQRRVRLAGNPIDCSCDNGPLLEALQRYGDQVDDIDAIECANDHTKVRQVNVSELCHARDLAETLRHQRESIFISAAAVTVVLAIIAVMLIAGYYYRRELQIFLFARGWCLCCIQEDNLDADRYYDVFLSFCHEDTELVLNELLPTLDQEYSVCIHNRDWCPGGMIPTQISISVEHSRRTIIVLSKNYLRSLWGMLEFRTAYASSLEERRVRVVMVVLDNVLEESELEGDLRSYVRFNTYLQWGDPWFWQKLRYALPHRRMSPAAPPCQRALDQHQEGSVEAVNQEIATTQV